MAKRREGLEELLPAPREGDRRALARAITLVENGDPPAYELVREVYPDTGSAYVVGVTGPLGRRQVEPDRVPGPPREGAGSNDRGRLGRSVEPLLPGCAPGRSDPLLEHFLDPSVFIRSMGTRGHLGGLAEATLQAVLILDAARKDIIFVETVGTGQSEVEVIGIADTVMLVLMPGSGDSIQA